MKTDKVNVEMSPFARLNIIQFLGSVNENLYKLLAAFFLIGDLGGAQANTILSIIGSVYTIPFILFSNLGGELADKYPKNRVILITRFCELATLVAGFFVFFFSFRSGRLCHPICHGNSWCPIWPLKIWCHSRAAIR